MNRLSVGAALRRLRNERGLTQEALAERLGVSVRSVSRWETGSNLPDLPQLGALADLLGVEVGALLVSSRNGGVSPAPTAAYAQIALVLSVEGRDAAACMTELFGVAPNDPATMREADVWRFLLGPLAGTSIAPALDALTGIFPSYNYPCFRRRFAELRAARCLRSRLILTVDSGERFPFALLTEEVVAFLDAIGGDFSLILRNADSEDGALSGAGTVHFKLILRGEAIDLDGLSEMMGLAPSFARRREDFPQVKAGTGTAQDMWMLETPRCPMREAESAMRSFVWLLEQKRDALAAVRKRWDCTAGIDLVWYVHEHGGAAELVLDPALLRFAAQTSTALAFDLYTT